MHSTYAGSHRRPERITRLGATAFRGILEAFQLELSGKSLVVLGENGTGKSTLADIVEFYFTGEIRYLAKEGRQKAVRHVGAGPPMKTSVEVITTGALGGRLEYSGKDAARNRISSNETFLLRGRTLSDFVNSSKGEKWNHLSSMLGLGDVDALRLKLQKVANSLAGAAQDCNTRLANASAALRNQGVSASEDAMWERVQHLCREAGFVIPSSLEEALEGALARNPDPSARRESVLLSAVASAKALDGYTVGRESLARWNAHLNEFGPRDRSRSHLMAAGREFIIHNPDIEFCPLCDHPVHPLELQTVVERTLADLRTASELLESARGDVDRILSEGESAYRIRADLVAAAEPLSTCIPELPTEPFTTARAALTTQHVISIDSLIEFSSRLREWDALVVGILESATSETPSVTTDPAFALGSLLSQCSTWAECVKNASAMQHAADLSKRIFEAYQDGQREYFAAMLSEISHHAADIYSRLHPGESLNAVGIEPLRDKGVELTVDFHGSIHKPPHGVLSESHLNSLAIALFVAMAQTFNQRVGFLVLDDVVNSFDFEHRGRLADLLANGFPDWQFIILTHDVQFYTRVRRLAPSWQALELTSWSYIEGPRLGGSYATADMYAAARAALEMHDRIGAAQKGRRALEEFLQEACEGLQAQLPFKRGIANDRREIGQVLSGLKSRLKQFDQSLARSLDSLFLAIDADVQAALNVESHASSGQASATDVKLALDHLEHLMGQLTCGHCKTRTWKQGGPDLYSCKCRSSIFPPSRIQA